MIDCIGRLWGLIIGVRIWLLISRYPCCTKSNSRYDSDIFLIRCTITSYRAHVSPINFGFKASTLDLVDMIGQALPTLLHTL
jgi:hypothetical protein